MESVTEVITGISDFIKAMQIHVIAKISALSSQTCHFFGW
jgi:hypothetical protein